MGNEHIGGRIHVLPPETARRIAAGEVIDRPFSVVRELLDNAVDAGASQIVVRLLSGGLDTITVSDDGGGMGAEDLALCYEPHSTSKIEDIDDLARVRTLGFRGEALASISGVARLSITSAEDDSGLAHEVVVRGGKRLAFRAVRAAKGTTATVSELFHNLPARRKFLRGASAESNLCRGAFLEKAVPHPGVAFRLFTEGDLRLFLPPAELVDRVAAANERLVDRRALHAVRGSTPGVDIEAVVSDPALSRSDRRLIHVYVNGRRIWEFAFVQAVEYAFSHVLPGGRFPIAFVFLSVDPSLVDFNIHPAKREARFQNKADIRSRIVDVIRGFLDAYEVRSARRTFDSIQLPFGERAEASSGPGEAAEVAEAPSRDRARGPEGPHGRSPFGDESRGESRRERESHGPPVERRAFDRSVAFNPDEIASTGTGIRYLGQVFGLFLVAARGSTLYVVDQHAAHERILFDRIRETRSSQQLLVPIIVEVADTSAFDSFSEKMRELGFEFEPAGPGRRQVTAVPQAASELPEETLRESLQSLQGSDFERWEWDFYAEIACKAAVKDGTPLDSIAARELLVEAFALPSPRCPHGRPVWFEVTRDELFSLVGRT